MAAQLKISRLVPVTALLLLALFASPVGAESGTEPSLPQMPKQPPDRNNSRSLISPGRHRPRSFWPRTGDTVASIRRIAETLKSHGYSVDLINVDASEDEAARRVVRRFLEIGRMLQARFLKESREHAHNSYEGLIRASRLPGPGRGKSSKTAKPYLGSSEEMERQYDEATLNWKPPKPKGRLASKSRTERE